MENDKNILRQLAHHWMELASLPVMAERKRLWTLLHDLRAERPMVYFETDFLAGYVGDEELLCQDARNRVLEKSMRWKIRHAEEIGDDIVVEPCWRVCWQLTASDYGVPIPMTTDQESGGFAFEHPVHEPEDVGKLHPRSWSVDREATRAEVRRIEEIFGDILPVELQGTAMIHSALTQDLYKLIGNENLLLWVYDAPDALHRAMAVLRDDRLAFFDWLDREGLVGLNCNSTVVAAGSPGFTTGLPQPDYAGRPRVRDVWTWMESQETSMLSPEMFGEFFLPYMADVAKRFGLVYYGCCEPVHDRWDLIRQAIPNIRTVSISPWCDRRLMAEKVGQSAVLSRKPSPPPMSGERPNWDLLEQDLDETLDATRGCNLEIIFRDVYQIFGDRPRLRRWVEMVRARIGGAMK